MFGYNVNNLERYEARLVDFVKNNIEANKNFSEEEKAKRTAGVISLYADTQVECTHFKSQLQ